VVGDFVTAPIREAHYHVAVCFETLFYASDQAGLVTKLAQVLAPRGYLLLTTINNWVYERSEDVDPPAPGQVRRWLTRRATRDLLAPHFELLHTETREPRGHRGILRWINSYKIAAAAAALRLDRRLTRCKELAGLGGGVVYLARKRD
jgi:hypothetical protein